eukprot:4923889-Pleurochrysis_carterae.AAC.1
MVHALRPVATALVDTIAIDGWSFEVVQHGAQKAQSRVLFTGRTSVNNVRSRTVRGTSCCFEILPEFILGQILLYVTHLRYERSLKLTPPSRDTARIPNVCGLSWISNPITLAPANTAPRLKVPSPQKKS